MLERKKYVNRLHMYFLPVWNPDGYEYTRKHVRQRERERERERPNQCC